VPTEGGLSKALDSVIVSSTRGRCRPRVA